MNQNDQIKLIGETQTWFGSSKKYKTDAGFFRSQLMKGTKKV